ncbi:hypothetical protein B0H11DRAFT_1902480 [Mycena galericulata]|nr:hypothetical protein B0H11DRAFT_1902480 [Mycena galericulata]
MRLPHLLPGHPMLLLLRWGARDGRRPHVEVPSPRAGPTPSSPTLPPVPASHADVGRLQPGSLAMHAPFGIMPHDATLTHAASRYRDANGKVLGAAVCASPLTRSLSVGPPTALTGAHRGSVRVYVVALQQRGHWAADWCCRCGARARDRPETLISASLSSLRRVRVMENFPYMEHCIIMDTLLIFYGLRFMLLLWTLDFTAILLTRPTYYIIRSRWFVSLSSQRQYLATYSGFLFALWTSASGLSASLLLWDSLTITRRVGATAASTSSMQRCHPVALGRHPVRPGSISEVGSVHDVAL